MQLFGFRKTPDLSLAPLQASCLRDLRAQIWRRAVVGSSRPFAHSGKSAVHKRPCFNDKLLIVEARSLRSALRAPVETTDWDEANLWLGRVCLWQMCLAEWLTEPAGLPNT